MNRNFGEIILVVLGLTTWCGGLVGFEIIGGIGEGEVKACLTALLIQSNYLNVVDT